MPQNTLGKVAVPPDMALALEEAPLRAWKEHLRAFQSLHSTSDDVKSPDCFDEPSNMDLYGQSSSTHPKSQSSSSGQTPENLAVVPETPFDVYEEGLPDPYQTGSAPNPNPYHPNNLYNPFFPGSQTNPFLPEPSYHVTQPFTSLGSTRSSNVTATPRRPSTSNRPSTSAYSGVKKVAIPRLPSREDSSRMRRRHITRACEYCRSRKIKCSGEERGCRTCHEYGYVCCYTEGKREKARTQVTHLEKNLDAYKKALEHMGHKHGLSDAEIEAALKVEASSIDLGSDTVKPHEENYCPASSRALDSVREDFNKDGPTLATGFIGRSSEFTWLQEVDGQLRTQRPASECETPIAAWNYYTDASVFRRYHPRPDPDGFPTAHVARRLYNTYFAHVHLTFPIIGRTIFDRQFHLVLTDPNIHGGNRFRAVLNMVFAIGALFVQLTDAGCGGDEQDHSLYFERARALNMDGTELDHFDVQQIQAKGLASLYLLATGQMNRAWRLCTNAVQGALDLGLHLRDVGSTTADDLKEIKYRVWWSLYTLEHRLSVITGRPSCIHDTDYSTPLPIPFDEVQFKDEEALRLLASSKDRTSQLCGSSSPFKQGGKGQAKYTDCDIQYADPSEALYFLQVVLLTSIGRRAANQLYGPQAVGLSWRHMRCTIQNLLDDLNSWVVNLPAVYDFTSIKSTPSPPSHTSGLAILYYSTKILITRACLYHLEVDDKGKDSEAFAETEKFNKEQAAYCINSACLLLRFLPEPPFSVDLYRSTPWWCILHFLMQTAAILLLELSLKCEHAPDKATTISTAARKLSEWLDELSVSDATPKKALNIYRKLLNQVEEYLDNDHGGDDCDDGCDEEDSDPTPRGPRARSPVDQAPPVVGEQAFPSEPPFHSVPQAGDSSRGSSIRTLDPRALSRRDSSDIGVDLSSLDLVDCEGFVGLLNNDSVPNIWDESLVPGDPPPATHGWAPSEGGMDMGSNAKDDEFW